MVIGLGYCYLGEPFLESDSAKILRDFLWQKDPKQRLTIDVKGSGFKFETDNFDKIFWTPDCWTIGVIFSNQSLWVLVVTPGGRSMLMLISDNLELFDNLSFDKKLDGRLNVINPHTKTVRIDVPINILLMEYTQRLQDELEPETEYE